MYGTIKVSAFFFRNVIKGTPSLKQNPEKKKNGTIKKDIHEKIENL